MFRLPLIYLIVFQYLEWNLIYDLFNPCNVLLDIEGLLFVVSSFFWSYNSMYLIPKKTDIPQHLKFFCMLSILNFGIISLFFIRIGIRAEIVGSGSLFCNLITYFLKNHICEKTFSYAYRVCYRCIGPILAFKIAHKRVRVIRYSLCNLAQLVFSNFMPSIS